MAKRVSGTSAVALGLLSVLLSVSPAGAQSVTVVPKLDFNRFMGTWYEVARYPTKQERSCIGDVFELIAPADKPNHMLLVKSCSTKSGYANVRNGSGKTQNKSGDGKLKVTYLWPFTKKYWVLALGPNYEWSLVGSPNRKELRVLSRTTSLKPEVLGEIEAKGAAEGFPAAKLVMTPQTAHTVVASGQ